jgi:hypothetical protein
MAPGGLMVASPPAVLAAPLPTYSAVPIESPSPEARTRFGDIMHTIGDIDGDGVREVITTAGVSVNGVTGVGQAYVLDGSTGAVLMTLNDPEPQAYAGFGASITGLGDVNGDGVPDIAVGAPFQTVNGNVNQGKMYVFSGKDGSLLYSIPDPNPQANAYFGALFVTATNDLNGDGVPDLAVAAPGETVNGILTAGAAYVFEGSNGSLMRRIPNPKPETFTATNEAFFSMGLTNPGDINGDGVDDLVVGFAGTTVDGNVDQGRAYLYSGKTGALLRTLDDPVPQPYAYFGSMYSDPGVPGDVNGDGVRDIYVDADGQIVAGLPDAGAAYVVSGKTGFPLTTLTSPAPQDHGFFGFISSPAGDLNGDGTPDLLVGQTGAAHVGGAYAYGGAWVFDLRDASVLADFTSIAPDAGQGVASPGDVNGDGFPDYFVSAPRTDIGANFRQGRVFQLLSTPPPPAPGPGPGPGPAPSLTVTTQPASNPTVSTAVLHGLIRTSGVASTWQFQYGRTTSYGTGTPIQAIPAGAGSVPVSWTVDRLSPLTTYHFRLVGIPGSGSGLNNTYGHDLTFTTSATGRLLLNRAKLIVRAGAVSVSFTCASSVSCSSKFSITTRARLSKNSKFATVVCATTNRFFKIRADKRLTVSTHVRSACRTLLDNAPHRSIDAKLTANPHTGQHAVIRKVVLFLK